MTENFAYDNNLDAYSYEDSLCTDIYTYVGYNYGACSTSYQYYSNCQFFVQVFSLATFSLTLSSTEPIVVSLLGDDNPIYSQISSNKISAEGKSLVGLQVHSGGENFIVEKQISPTQYSSSIGVFTFGETYSHIPFTFTVSATQINLPFPPLLKDISSVNFAPFLSAQVTNENTFTTYHLDGAEVIVFVDNENYNLEGLVLTNPYYSIQNMTFFPPFQQNVNNGQLVFQLEASDSPFLTVECNQYVSYISSSFTYDIFQCGMGSLPRVSESFFSFSLDEIGHKKIRQPDEMSFSLF